MSVVKDATISVILHYNSGMLLHTRTAPQVEVLGLITWGARRTRCTFLQYRVVKKVNQSCYRPEVTRGFQEVKVPRLRDSGPGWW